MPTRSSDFCVFRLFAKLCRVGVVWLTTPAGHGGQSLGFALAGGITLEVEGDSNDG